MDGKKSKEGICAICGMYKKLSFEHVPPQSAFNDKPIFIQTHQHLLDENSHLYGKKMLNHKGFGRYTLCTSCNNNTGDWYARDFADFAKQGMNIIKAIKPQYVIKGSYKIKPLNVLKQILAMFMSADTSGHLRSQNDLVEFILHRETMGLPNRFKIFMYSTLSPFKRMFGYSIVSDDNLNIQKWSEINFQPFRYLLTEDSNAAHEHMLDITDFGKLEYNKSYNIDITTAYLKVDSPWIGTYGQ